MLSVGYGQFKSDIKFDVIVIDGIERFACAQEAVKNLKQDGFIILDNSDWHEKTSEFLRAHDLIEIDMSGFGPINNYTWTTSLFLKRGVDLVPLSTRQPLHAIGALKKSEHR